MGTGLIKKELRPPWLLTPNPREIFTFTVADVRGARGSRLIQVPSNPRAEQIIRLG